MPLSFLIAQIMAKEFDFEMGQPFDVSLTEIDHRPTSLLKRDIPSLWRNGIITDEDERHRPLSTKGAWSDWRYRFGHTTKTSGSKVHGFHAKIIEPGHVLPNRDAMEDDDDDDSPMVIFLPPPPNFWYSGRFIFTCSSTFSNAEPSWVCILPWISSSQSSSLL